MVDTKTQAILSFLQSHAEAVPDLQEKFTQMEDLYTRKLWHQLTVLLESFFLEPAAADLLIPHKSALNLCSTAPVRAV